MLIMTCPCGGSAELMVSAARVAARDQAALRLQETRTAEDFAAAQAECNALAYDVVEVRCAKCAVYLANEQKPEQKLSDVLAQTASVWNRAVQKFSARADCCMGSDNQVQRKGAFGMVIVKCRVCGTRNLPFGMVPEAEAPADSQAAAHG